jgi:hypothetical protein
MTNGINPFPADVANKQHRGSAPKSHFCDLTRKTEVTGLSIFIDLGCVYCKKTQRAVNVLKNTLDWKSIQYIKSYSKFNWLECGNFSQSAGTPGTERDIAFSQLAVKGLNRCLEVHLKDLYSHTKKNSECLFVSTGYGTQVEIYKLNTIFICDLW